MACEDGDAIGQGGAQLVEALAGAQRERDHAMAEPAVDLAHACDLGLVVGEVDLGQREHRVDPAAPGGHEVAVDQAGPERGVGHRGDDHEHVDVGRDDLLLVAERAAQEGAVARQDGLDAHGAVGQLAHLDAIADDRPRPPQPARDRRLALLAAHAHDDELVVHGRDQALRQ